MTDEVKRKPRDPRLGTKVQGRTILGKTFRGLVMVVAGPVQGIDSVKVAVIGHDYLLHCHWYPKRPSTMPDDEPWQCCWPNEG